MGKAGAHRLLRQDARAAIEGASAVPQIVAGIGNALPPAALLAWSFHQFRKPIQHKEGVVQDNTGLDSVLGALRLAFGNLPIVGGFFEGFSGPSTYGAILTGWDSAQAEIIRRVNLVVMPFAVTLGAWYQGLQGAITGAIATELTAVVAAMSVERFDKLAHLDFVGPPTPAQQAERDAAISKNPFPGHRYYWRLSIPDALYLASFLPLLLLTVRAHQPAPSGLV
jgi:hypothetical protein